MSCAMRCILICYAEFPPVNSNSATPPRPSREQVAVVPIVSVGVLAATQFSVRKYYSES
jgi:hypothetical protein